ncbi:MAG: hypothetical protein R6U56_10210, partial [Opitutales bacterium]
MTKGIKKPMLVCLSLFLAGAAYTQAEPSKEQLMQRLETLNKELESTKAALRESEKERLAEKKAAQTPASEKVGQLEEDIANAADMGPSKITPGDLFPVLEGLKIGGAMRANYYLGDYTVNNSNNSAERGDDGTISLDTFRINMDYERGPWIGKFEYRFYPGYSTNNSDGYHFLHTGWLGYNFENAGQVQVGVNRVPFGPGAYGVSQSWFFDQHYYVGLSDDMDLGVKYTTEKDNWTFDLAYYYSDEGTWTGSTRDSSRYSYDVVDSTGDGYEERNQFNARAIYAAELGEVNIDVGASAQFGLLESNGPQDDGEHYALSVHPTFKWNNWTLAPQLTYYKYNIDGYVDTTDDGIDNPTDDLIQFGAYDFPTFVATEAWIPAVSLSYYHETNQVDWLDYVIPYVEYSAIVKAEDDFNDSEFITAGAAWGRGGWYIYTEFAFSNGNDFIGNEAGYGDPT